MRGEIKYVDGKRVATPEYRAWQSMKTRCLNPVAELEQCVRKHLEGL